MEVAKKKPYAADVLKKEKASNIIVPSIDITAALGRFTTHQAALQIKHFSFKKINFYTARNNKMKVCIEATFLPITKAGFVGPIEWAWLQPHTDV